MAVLTGEVSPRALARLAADGDRAAFGRMWSAHRFVVFRSALRWTAGSQVLAEDVTSRTFEQALSAMSRWEDRGVDPAAWLVTIAHRVHLDHCRSAASRQEQPAGLAAPDLPEAAAPAAHEPAAVAETTDLTGRLRVALAQLGHLERRAIRLRYWSERTIPEVAHALGCTIGIARSILNRALRHLRRHPLIQALRGGT